MKTRYFISWNGVGDVFRPGTSFYALRKEMDRKSDHFPSSFLNMNLFPAKGSSLGNLTPRVDVMETDAEIQVTAELPGMDEKDVEVIFSNESLTIKGEKKAAKEDKEKGHYRMERSYGSFQRDILIPVEVDAEKIDATFKNGVLTVKFPKIHSAQNDFKKIEVKSG